MRMFEAVDGWDTRGLLTVENMLLMEIEDLGFS